MHRLADIAKELRITNQELRRELNKTNFGISPGAHEVEDALASGIIRFLKTRVKPTLKRQRAAAVVDKSGRVKDEKPEPEEGGAESDEGNEGEDQEPRQNDESGEVKKAESGTGPSLKKAPSADLAVSRRIEVDALETPSDSRESLPHTYYKSKKRKRRKGAKTEDQILEVLKRHPHTVARRKQQVARARHDAGEGEISLEELAVARAIDRERFRDQKKHRAVSQKRGPKAQPQIKAKVGVVELPGVISVKEFAEKTGLPVPDVIRQLVKNGILATVNQKIDFDTAAVIADEMKVEVARKQKEASSADLFEGNLKNLLKEENQSDLQDRPPVISVMGHVDHGKTRILDAIRETNVMAGEAGGITQHIGAYQVEKNGHRITFLDTPGHEAFTAMRARGARATDIAILVVAADEGVKPQTIEAIHHAKEAGIPIIVAINKIDRPGANIEKVKGQLVEYDLQPEDWGGKTVMVPVSAETKEGIRELLDMILLVAEMENLKANPDRPAVGTVVESHLDPSLGPVATMLINTGTLKVGESIVVGTVAGKVKAMHDHTGRSLRSIGPSGAVKISGLNQVPEAGELLQAFGSDRVAKKRAGELLAMEEERRKTMGGSMVERIVSQISTGKINYLKIVLKTDTKGSLEAIMEELQKVRTDEVAIKVIHYGVGNISDTDVIMAAASQGLLVGFHTKVSPHVKKVAEKESVDIRNYTVIYKLIEDVKGILSGMLEPEETLIELGKLEIRQIFLDKKKWMIVGGKVTEGKIEAGARLRVTRDGEELFESRIESLKHVNEEVKLLEKDSECGIKLNIKKPLLEGDILEAYKVERRERTLQ